MRGISSLVGEMLKRLWPGDLCPARRSSLHVIARSGATKQSSFLFSRRQSWIASRSLSSGAHSRDPLARNDGERDGCLPPEPTEDSKVTLVRDSTTNKNRKC